MTMKMSVLRLFSNHKYKAKSCLKEHDFALYSMILKESGITYMKVLSMIQPWASLFLSNEAHYETRTWNTKYRGSLAIHTSKKIDSNACNNEIIHSILSKQD